jgi:3-methyladenine DNA glycosylase AlkD
MAKSQKKEKSAYTLKGLRKELRRNADMQQAKIMQRFFKTGKGEYGEGDVFLGLKTPVLRLLLKGYETLQLEELHQMLLSPIHEERAGALALLVRKFEKGTTEERKGIFDFYMKNCEHINNWDLVDLTAPHIVGKYLLDKDRTCLYDLARSENLWKRRIAMLATFTFIRNNEYDDALYIAEILLHDEQDLMHKAVGWMLREIGKRDIKAEEKFLKKQSRIMPRTMLRYAIEKFDQEKRKMYMGKVRN